MRNGTRQGQGDVWEETTMSDQPDSCLQLGEIQEKLSTRFPWLRGPPLEDG